MAILQGSIIHVMVSHDSVIHAGCHPSVIHVTVSLGSVIHVTVPLSSVIHVTILLGSRIQAMPFHGSVIHAMPFHHGCVFQAMPLLHGSVIQAMPFFGSWVVFAFRKEAFRLESCNRRGKRGENDEKYAVHCSSIGLRCYGFDSFS